MINHMSSERGLNKKCFLHLCLNHSILQNKRDFAFNHSGLQVLNLIRRYKYYLKIIFPFGIIGKSHTRKAILFFKKKFGHESNNC
jgi:hypothetical protein